MALSSSPNMRVKTVDVRPGLAVLRYTSADASGSPPLLRLVIPEESGELRVISEPENPEPELTRVGQCVVLQVSRRTTLVLHVIPRHGTSGNVSLALEYLTDERALGQSRNTNHSASSGHALQDVRWRDEDMPSLSMLAHVSRLGDRRVAMDEWVAGPGCPLPIEGLQIHFTSRVEGLELLYGVAEGGRVRRENMVVAGIFVGTRGRARPLRCVAFLLDGPRSNDFTLRVEATFLAAPVRSSSGRSVSFTGSTGNEPLTGLKINLGPANAEERSSGTRTKRSPRVQVFR